MRDLPAEIRAIMPEYPEIEPRVRQRSRQMGESEEPKEEFKVSFDKEFLYIKKKIINEKLSPQKKPLLFPYLTVILP